MKVIINKGEIGNIVILAVATGAAIGLCGRIDYAHEPFCRWDLRAYLPMAQAAPGLDTHVERPFVYRILGPYLAGLMPGAAPEGFYVLTLTTGVLCVFGLYVFLRRMGIGAAGATVAGVLFCFNRYFFCYNVWNYFQLNDFLMLLFLPILFGAMMGNRWGLFGVVLFLGALTRETAMLMVPTVFFYLWEKRILRREWKRAIVAAGPAVAVFLAMRLLISAPGENLFQAVAANITKLALAESWFRLLINAFIPLTFVPFVFFGETRAFFRDRKYALAFLAMVFLSSLFGINDERLMAPAFVVFYWLIAHIIERQLKDRWGLLILISLCGFACSFHYIHLRFGFMDRRLSMIVTFVATFVLTAAVVVHRIQARRAEKSRF